MNAMGIVNWRCSLNRRRREKGHNLRYFTPVTELQGKYKQVETSATTEVEHNYDDGAALAKRAKSGSLLTV